MDAKEALKGMAQAEPESDHMMVSGHESGWETHHVLSGSKRVHGPDMHKTKAALMSHMKATMCAEPEE